MPTTYERRTLKGRSKPLGICWEPITRLWFWDCRVCPGWPTVGHASTQPGALGAALFHVANSATHRRIIEQQGAER